MNQREGNPEIYDTVHLWRRNERKVWGSGWAAVRERKRMQISTCELAKGSNISMESAR